MNWNIEHMNSWWQGGNADPPVMRESFSGSNFSPAVGDIPGLAQRVGNVISAVDPDVVTIQEGAGIPEMKDFFNRFVDGDRWQIQRGAGGAQALVVAARTDRHVSVFEPGPETAGPIDLNQPFQADVDGNLELADLKFTRKPQVVRLVAYGRPLLIVNNHLKSKFVAKGRQLFNAGGAKRREFFAGSLINRRRISAEAFRLRTFLDELFVADPQAQILVTGDLNDGPGADFFETNFLTHSVVDRVFGSIFYPERQLVHALFQSGSTDFTAKFFDFVVGEDRELILDHIGISQSINHHWTWQGRVAVAEFEAQSNEGATVERDRHPSDHRPVVLEMTPNCQLND
ncbi:MAG: hypothetical protein AAGD25_23645 [Cyanobacteria bacterium P01_F01_bin.150]